jgi:hypothetical protein
MPPAHRPWVMSEIDPRRAWLIGWLGLCGTGSRGAAAGWVLELAATQSRYQVLTLQT